MKLRPDSERFSAEKKKPRGGSRGAHDTQVFPAVSPGRNGVGGRIYSPQQARVNSSRDMVQGRWLTRFGLKGMTLMKFNTLVRTTALLGALCLAVPLFAKPFVKTLSISQPAKVGQVTLQAGEYRFSIDGDKVTVQRGREQVAQSEGRWEERSTKSDYDAVLLNADGHVKEVRFSGQKRVFVFND